MSKQFLDLKRNCKKDNSCLIRKKLAILGDCATQHLATAIKGFAYDEGYAIDVFDADYNQIEAQCMDPTAELYAFRPNATLLFMCTEKLHERFYSESVDDRENFANRVFAEIHSYWTYINKNIKTAILQFNFAEDSDCIFGNYGSKVSGSFIFQLRKLNCLLMEGSQAFRNLILIDLSGIQNQYGRQYSHDRKMYYLAKMPLTTDILPVVAKNVVDVMKALDGKIRKCVVLDLDNTIWGGVIGDDGLEGIQIGELGAGHAFVEIQRWLKELKNRGVLLAVCSKNNEDTAKAPFIHHPEMVLRLDDIALFVANWEEKSQNIRMIQHTLNIGMDSMVFLDDNPFERNLVKSRIPEITVPELPEDPADYLNCLLGMNLFETASYSDEDKDRTKQYKEEASRTAMQTQFESYDDFLAQLNMVATAKPFDAFHYPRIAQLTQRSNQFNLRTVRYTEAEVEALAQDRKYFTLYFTLADSIGDHGLISAVIMERREDQSLFIVNWMMSCRVLKRGMEEFIVNKIIQVARENGFERVVGEYIKTPKNAMVEHIYERLGFQSDGNTFVATVETFVPNKTLIKE